MQSAPREIQDDLEEEPIALSEEELAAGAEIKSEEEITAEAKIKAEEEEVAASMREITHRAKEEALEENDSLEQSIPATTADSETEWTSSQQEREGEAAELSKKTEGAMAETKTNSSLKLPHDLPARKNILEQKELPNKMSSALPKGLGEPVAAGSFPLLEVELSFVLGQQSISLEDLRSLAVEKIIPLGGSDFQASILLQGKKIAEAQLVMVDQVPSLQITRIIASQ